MKKFLFLAVSAAWVGSAAFAAGGGADTVRREIVGGVLHSIEASSGFQVRLTQGANARAVISVDKRLEPYLICYVEEGELKLGFRSLPWGLQNRNKWNQQPKAEVTVTSLRDLEVTSGASVFGYNKTITAHEVDIEASSGAQVKALSLQAGEVSIDVSSGAAVNVGGSTDVLDVECSSGSNASLRALKAVTVEAEVSSGASIHCFVTGLLRAEASSGGSIGYDTGGKNITLRKQVSSGGSVAELK